MHFKKTFFSWIFSFFIFSELLCGIETTTSFVRKDGSQATVYINTPENSESFPLVVYIDGAHMQSVKNNFSVLSVLFDLKKIGVVALEKRGITSDAMNVPEFLAYDCYENRLQDHIQFIREFNPPNWNGQIVFIGSLEGGKIVPQLTLQFADKTRGTILLSSGGGLSFGEEIKYQIKQIALENGYEYNESELDKLIDDQYAKILEQPQSLELWYEKTFQWFASYLKYNLLKDLLQINTPILMIHGVLDTHIPVASADCIKNEFDAAGKENLTYARYEDLGYSISKRMDIFMLLLNYSAEHFAEEPPAAEF